MLCVRKLFDYFNETKWYRDQKWIRLYIANIQNPFNDTRMGLYPDPEDQHEAFPRTRVECEDCALLRNNRGRHYIRDNKCCTQYRQGDYVFGAICSSICQRDYRKLLARLDETSWKSVAWAKEESIKWMGADHEQAMIANISRDTRWLRLQICISEETRLLALVEVCTL